ncbi:phosphoethanolamine transferase [Deltaproteobacteria bacterium PRO3]|nr:phosphoethanolamine transferase [Deltaproteobacteria bacterium PRO3]
MSLDSSTIHASKWREFGLLALCYALALLPPFLVELWKGYSGVYYLYDSRNPYILNTLLIASLFSLGLAWVTMHAGHLQRFVFALLLLPLTFLGTLALVHVALYDAPISVGAVDALLGTDLHEAKEYLSFHWNRGMTLSLAGYGALYIAAVFWAWRGLSPGRPRAAAHVLAWSALAALALSAYRFPAIAAYNLKSFEQRPLWSRAAELNRQLPSIRILHDVGNWLAYRQWLEETQQVRAGHDFGAVLGDASRPRTLVLVIGESLRRDRMSLYGYTRPTTPRLDARRKQILAFDGAISPSNQTVPSVTKMLTPATIQEPDRFLTEPSILAAAKKAGYRTYWLSNQGRVGQFDSLISLIAHDAETTIFTNTEFYGTVYDEALLRPLEAALSEPYPHKLIVLHTLGSHQSYRNRYPPEKAVFRAQDYVGEVLDEEQASILAEYDSSVRYTDEVLDGVLRKLESRPGSMLLYVSDHGERLYEKDVNTCGHGFPEPMRSEFDIPYFLWCQGECPRALKRIHARNRGVAFNTENLFHTLANLLALKMAEYDPKSDVLSPKYRPVWHPQIIDVNRGIHTYASLPE